MVAICLLVKVRNVCVGDRGEAGARMVPGHHINNTAEDTRLTHYTTTRPGAVLNILKQKTWEWEFILKSFVSGLSGSKCSQLYAMLSIFRTCTFLHHFVHLTQFSSTAIQNNAKNTLIITSYGKCREGSPLSPHAGGQHSWQWIMGVSWYRTVAGVIIHTMINLYADYY